MRNTENSRQPYSLPLCGQEGLWCAIRRLRGRRRPLQAENLYSGASKIWIIGPTHECERMKVFLERYQPVRLGPAWGRQHRCPQSPRRMAVQAAVGALRN